MADSLEVRLHVGDVTEIRANRTDKPAAERNDPTKAVIYRTADGSIDVVLSREIEAKQKTVTIPSGAGTGAKMDVWTGPQMVEEAIKYGAAGVKPLANGVPINVTGP